MKISELERKERRQATKTSSRKNKENRVQREWVRGQMAESVVSCLIQYLGPLLANEVELLKDVGSKARKIKKDLDVIRSFLRDADAKQDGNEVLKTLLKEVREVAYDTQDVLDEYMRLLPQQQHDAHGPFGFFKKTGFAMQSIRARYEAAKEIEEIQKSLEKIREDIKHHDLTRIEEGSSFNISNNQWYDPRQHSLFVEESKLKGIDLPRRQLMEWLVVEGESNRLVTSPSELSVISMVGMGGVGKTTLVRNVYDKVKACFATYAWFTVSQTFKQQDLLKGVIEQFHETTKEPIPQGLDAKTSNQLIQMLRDYLQSKSYLLVLDDVWSKDVWNYVAIALPSSNLGSRVILTTRDEDVASSSRAGLSNHIYPLQHLNEEDAWSLFCSTTFPGSDCPPQLKKLSQNFAKRCRGLPLAIVALGSFLSNKLYEEWEMIDRSFGPEFESNDDFKSLKEILLLSFNDLPYFLRICFQYLSIFPEDYKIKPMKLVRLWIAEGFVKKMEGRTLEEVANGYFNALIRRNLVQVVQRKPCGAVRTCRVHDLLREIIVSKSKEQNFCTYFHEQDSASSDKIRRLAVYNSTDNVLPNSESHSSLRSLCIFGVDELPRFVLNPLLTASRFLRVVDLENAPIDSFPDELTSLFHLRYLNLAKTKIQQLPKSLGKLTYLETLNLKGTLVRELPVEILMLMQLRHLLIYRYEKAFPPPFNCIYGVKVPLGIGTLTSLEKLANVEANSENGLVRELKNLKQLRKLGISRLRSADRKYLCTSIENMRELRSLCMMSMHEDEALDLHSLSNPPPYLQHLKLAGRLGKSPHWIASLQNLVNICLFWSKLRKDPLRLLQSLPNLTQLGLWKAYDGEELCCEAGGYQRLKMLTLFQLSELKNVRVEKGAMINLEILDIAVCETLVEVPSCLQNLTKLQHLRLRGMPEAFVRSISKDGGKDRWKVQHISRITNYDGNKRFFDLS